MGLEINQVSYDKQFYKDEMESGCMRAVWIRPASGVFLQLYLNFMHVCVYQVWGHPKETHFSPWITVKALLKSLASGTLFEKCCSRFLGHI